MLSELNYGTFLDFSPRGANDVSRDSRMLCGSIKNGDKGNIESVVSAIRRDHQNFFSEFLNGQTLLVPIPRSALMMKGALWPSKVIADILVSEGLGAAVDPCVQRIVAIPKSSSQYTAVSRNSVETHLNSLKVNVSLYQSYNQITVIDDVTTLGRTSFSCGYLLKEALPNVEVRSFSLLRTQGFLDEITELVSPRKGLITYYPSGKTFITN